MYVLVEVNVIGQFFTRIESHTSNLPPFVSSFPCPGGARPNRMEARPSRQQSDRRRTRLLPSSTAWDIHVIRCLFGAMKIFRLCRCHTAFMKEETKVLKLFYWNAAKKHWTSFLVRMFSYCHTAAAEIATPPNPTVKTSGPVRDDKRLRPPRPPPSGGTFGFNPSTSLFLVRKCLQKQP